MDWMQTGWGPEYSTQYDQKKEFHINWKNVKHTTRDLLTVSFDVISSISKNYPEPYTLMASGGVDTQAMLWCWVNSDVNFNVVVVRYVTDSGQVLNNHDISNIIEVSEKYKFDITYIDFNVIKFLEEDLKTYALKYYCTSPQLCTYMAMSELVTEGTVLFSGDFQATACYNYTMFGLMRYADISGRNIIPYFLLHDPELTTMLNRVYQKPKNIPYRMHRPPRLAAGEQDEHGRLHSIYNSKVKAMQEIGIPLIPQSTKLTGFEIIKTIYDDREDLVNSLDKIKHSNKPSKRIFDLVFRYNLIKWLPYKERVIWDM